MLLLSKGIDYHNIRGFSILRFLNLAMENSCKSVTSLCCFYWVIHFFVFSQGKSLLGTVHYLSQMGENIGGT